MLRSCRSISLLCCTLLSVGSAHAEFDTNRLWLNAGFYSVHFDASKGLRNANPGLGVEYKMDDVWSATAGQFINSDSERSTYLGAYYQPWHAGSWKLGGVAGLFNGYPNAFGGRWFPAVLPVATLEDRNLGFNFVVIPPLRNRLYGAISIQIKFSVK